MSDGTILTNANCRCGSKLKVTCDLKTLRVDVKNISIDFTHNRKYQVRGEFKEKALEQLEHKTALSVRTNITNEMIPDNEILNSDFDPITPQLNALRLISSRKHKIEEDSVDVILNWKDAAYVNVISAVCHSPFYVFYRTALQLAWYIVESKKQKSIRISIDATGSVAIAPPRSQKIEGSDTLKHVFLYSIMAKTASKSVPIAQMLPQDQTSEFIELFLRKMFKNLKPSKEIVCDESNALLKAIVATFASRESLENYVAHCVTSLQTGGPLPKVYVRIDRSHFVKNIARKIKDRDFRRRNFYRGVIGYLVQCDNFDNHLH